MSCFTGKLNEYPSISVDCFDKNNLDSDVYFLSHCHQDHMNGLDSSAFLRKLKSSSNTFVYCSETSRNILLCDERYKHLEKYLVGIAIENPTLITFYNTQAEKNETVSVTLLSAGHCVGSVMILFDGTAGTVLYTGDFRWSKGDASRMSFFHSGSSIRDINSIYVDTTFYLPQMKHIPSRDSTKNAVVRLINCWLSKGCNYYVSLLCKGMLGYEFLMKEVASAFNTKIHVCSQRLALYQNLPDMTQHFTTDGESTRIHSCNWESKRNLNSKLPCGFSLPAPQKMKVLKIKATSMWFARRSQPLPADCVFQVDNDFYRVVHSMHASMEEIIDLVSYLRPLNVYPTVKPAGLYTLKDAQESLQRYTRQKDGCLQNGNATDDEKAVYYADQKSSTLSNVSSLVPHYPPSNEVIAECKQLGLEEGHLMAKPRKRRRRNNETLNHSEKVKIPSSETTKKFSCDVKPRNTENIDAESD